MLDVVVSNNGSAEWNSFNMRELVCAFERYMFEDIMSFEQFKTYVHLYSNEYSIKHLDSCLCGK